MITSNCEGICYIDSACDEHFTLVLQRLPKKTFKPFKMVQYSKVCQMSLMDIV